MERRTNEQTNVRTNEQTNGKAKTIYPYIRTLHTSYVGGIIINGFYPKLNLTYILQPYNRV